LYTLEVIKHFNSENLKSDIDYSSRETKVIPENVSLKCETYSSKN
jgi:hypothetical protein